MMTKQCCRCLETKHVSLFGLVKKLGEMLTGLVDGQYSSLFRAEGVWETPFAQMVCPSSIGGLLSTTGERFDPEETRAALVQIIGPYLPHLLPSLETCTFPDPLATLWGADSPVQQVNGGG
jgi:hypothetical protein